MKNQINQKTRRVKRGPESQEMPINDTPSNASADRMGIAIVIGSLLLAAGTAGVGTYYGVTSIQSAFRQPPIDWLHCILMAALIVVSLLVARSIAWLGLFGAIAQASRMGGWNTVEAIGRSAPKLRKLLPGGTPWLSTALVQSLVNRGQYKEAIVRAEEEWARTSNDAKQRQTLGTICFTAAIAKQGEGEIKASQLWNERSIEILNKSLEELSKPPKGMVAKVLATQSEQSAANCARN